jgi:hypothetical protein
MSRKKNIYLCFLFTTSCNVSEGFILLGHRPLHTFFYRNITLPGSFVRQYLYMISLIICGTVPPPYLIPLVQIPLF